MNITNINEILDIQLKSRMGTKIINNNSSNTSVHILLTLLKQLLKKHKIKNSKIKNYHLTKGQKNNIKKINRDKTIRYRVRLQKKTSNIKYI
jgi:hypothetical protein